jgi:hypothetical protein
MAGDDLPTLQAEYDRLVRLINSGVQAAAHKGKQVTYQSLEALEQRAARLARQIERRRRSSRTIVGYEPEC